MTVAVENNKIITKIEELKEKAISTPMAQMDEDGAVHIVFVPKQEENSIATDLKDTFDIIRQNFEKYTKNAVKQFKDYEKIPRLKKYLDTALQEFAQNINRFMPNIQNTDYKFNVSVSGREKTDVRIGFKNPQGKQIGPFLSTHITSSPQDMLAVDIGYMDKHKKPVYTHSFGYESLEDVDNYMEKRGDKTFMKTEKQRHHDKYKDIIEQETRRRLERKLYR